MHLTTFPRGRDLPHRLPPSAIRQRLPLGHPRHRLHHARHLPRHRPLHQTARPILLPPQGLRRLIVPRSPLPPLLSGRLFRVHGDLHPVLLYRTLRHPGLWHERRSRYLPPSRRQRRILLRSPLPELAGRQHRASERADPLRARRVAPGLLLDRRPQLRGPPRLLRPLWLLLRHLCVAARTDRLRPLGRYEHCRHEVGHGDGCRGCGFADWESDCRRRFEERWGLGGVAGVGGGADRGQCGVYDGREVGEIRRPVEDCGVGFWGVGITCSCVRLLL